MKLKDNEDKDKLEKNKKIFKNPFLIKYSQ